GPILLSSKGEVLNAFVGGHEDVPDLLECLRQELDPGDFQLETRQTGIARGPGGGAGGQVLGDRAGAGPGAELHPHGIERNVNGGIFEPEHDPASPPSAPSPVAGNTSAG